MSDHASTLAAGTGLDVGLNFSLLTCRQKRPCLMWVMVAPETPNFFAISKDLSFLSERSCLISRARSAVNFLVGIDQSPFPKRPLNVLTTLLFA